MKTFLAAALLALVASAEEPVAEVDVTATTVDVTADVGTTEVVAEETTVDVVVEPVVDPAPVEDELLMDYIDQQGKVIKDEMHVAKITTEETVEKIQEQADVNPYIKGDLISVHGDECEKAIGHDGHYDEATGVWMLEEDWDYEPEWRCLMRPLLRSAVTDVQAAELSVESKSILQEKEALVKVHERLVQEAKDEHEKASCLEYIERRMARYQECELEVLRTYVQVADAYPTTWVQFLEQKKVCVDTFAAEVAECSRLFIWGEDDFKAGLEMVGVKQEHIDVIVPV